LAWNSFSWPQEARLVASIIIIIIIITTIEYGGQKKFEGKSKVFYVESKNMIKMHVRLCEAHLLVLADCHSGTTFATTIAPATPRYAAC